MRKRAAKQIAQTGISVRWGGLDGASLELDDDTCDAGVITFALCTIPEPVSALRELRRVIKPGGELRVLEHGLSPDPAVQRWQHRFNPLQKRMADGCSLVHDPVAALNEAGWTITNTYQRYAPGPKPWCYLSSLRAV
jgi:ubiquinone/menaquinone biosynthesis C-methylase UbiE